MVHTLFILFVCCQYDYKAPQIVPSAYDDTQQFIRSCKILSAIKVQFQCFIYQIHNTQYLRTFLMCYKGQTAAMITTELYLPSLWHLWGIYDSAEWTGSKPFPGE